MPFWLSRSGLSEAQKLTSTTALIPGVKLALILANSIKIFVDLAPEVGSTLITDEFL